MSLPDEKNWDLIHKMLEAEASGKPPRMFSSQRTLFGIPSELDRELEAFAKEKQGAHLHETDSSAQDPAREVVAKDLSAPDSAMNNSSQRSVELGNSTNTGLGSSACSHSSSAATRVEHPLEPVFNDESRVLILGTMPSPKSRETGFYYNHPQNRFWPVMARIFNEPLPTTNEEKRNLALKHHVALWDVLASCEIEGAKDVSIAQCVPNDISLITSNAPIHAIFCTGAKATELYNKYCKDQTGMDCTRLPSTSPANAACSLEKLVQAYKQIVPLTQE